MGIPTGTGSYGCDPIRYAHFLSSRFVSDQSQLGTNMLAQLTDIPPPSTLRSMMIVPDLLLSALILFLALMLHRIACVHLAFRPLSRSRMP